MLNTIGSPMGIENAVRSACLLEVTARKVGNVHPLAAFADCDRDTFAASADAIAPVLAEAAARPLGETILRAVEATQDRVGRNTNLGIVLLLSPLASVPPGEDLRAGVARVLSGTTVEDCRAVYEAIRRANPGGLGSADREDVSSPPTITLAEAMRLAADRDAVARQYANGFADVFAFSPRLTARDLASLEEEIVTTHVEMIASRLETLILRKCGPQVAAEAASRAEAVLRADPDRRGEALREYDGWLRADGNRRNPGTTADLMAAALFVATRERAIPEFDSVEIARYTDELRMGRRPLPDFTPR